MLGVVGVDEVLHDRIGLVVNEASTSNPRYKIEFSFDDVESYSPPREQSHRSCGRRWWGFGLVLSEISHV